MITPSCLRSIYNFSSYKPSPKTTGSKIGVVSYLGDYASNEDLQAFFKEYSPTAEGSTFKVLEVNGGQYNESETGSEATLDIQVGPPALAFNLSGAKFRPKYATSLTYPIPATVYSVGGEPPFIPDYNTPSAADNEPYLDWVQYALNQSDETLPQTVSTSYADNEQTVPKDYATRVCNSFAQLGARGVSLIFGSGDAGVGGGSCEVNDGSNATRFQPMFPASWYAMVTTSMQAFPDFCVAHLSQPLAALTSGCSTTAI